MVGRRGLRQESPKQRFEAARPPVTRMGIPLRTPIMAKNDPQGFPGDSPEASLENGEYWPPVMALTL